MSQIKWNKVRTGLNKVMFTRHFWEGADFVFSEMCKTSKKTVRQVFGLKPSREYIRVRLSDSITVEDSNIGHRAKRSILRKVGRYLRDNSSNPNMCHRTKLGKCDEYLQWREDINNSTRVSLTSAINDAKLEYLGWPIEAESDEYY